MKKLCEDMAMSMYREGRSDREIAEAIGYSRVSITNWRKDRGLPPNRKRRTGKMIDAYKAAMPLERAQELAQAEKDGRLVVLPCKVGDLLYEIDLLEYGVITCKVLEVHAYIGPDMHVQGAPMVSAESVSVEVVDGHGKGSGYTFETPDFGKTVFLTREEAEAALKKREADNEAD